MTDKGTIIWLPIEGAPKDGVEVLGYGFDPGEEYPECFIMRWGGGRWYSIHADVNIIATHYALINPPDTEAE